MFLDNSTFKQFIIDRTKKFFSPLKNIWFWIFAISFGIIATIIEGLGYTHY